MWSATRSPGTEQPRPGAGTAHTQEPVLCPCELWCTQPSQTTLPEDTPSQALLSRKPTERTSHLLRDEGTASAAPPACSHSSAEQGAATPQRQRNPVWQHEESRQRWSWQQLASGIMENVQEESEIGISWDCRGSTAFISCWNTRTSISLLPT